MAVGGCVAVAAVADDWVSGSGKVSFEGAFMVSRDRDLKQGMTADAPDTRDENMMPSGLDPRSCVARSRVACAFRVCDVDVHGVRYDDDGVARPGEG